MRRRPGARRGLAALAVVAALFAGAPALAVGEPSPGDPTSGDSAIVQVDEVADDQVTEPGQGTEVPGAGTEVPGEGETGDETQEPVATYVAQIGDVQYTSLGAAIDAANLSTEPTVITLLTSCTLDKPIAVQAEKNVTITAESNSGIKITDEARKGITLSTNTQLTIENVEIDTNGQIYLNGKGGSLAFRNVTLTMDGEMYQFNSSGYYCCAISIEQSESSLTFDGCEVYIENYPSSGSAIRWNGSGTDTGYNVTIENSTTLTSTNCYSGFVGTCDIVIDQSEVNVISHRGNGSNGSYYDIKDGSTVTFSGNGSHGISAGGLKVSGGSTVTSTDNGMYGIYTENILDIDGTSTVNVSRNSAKGDYAGFKIRPNVTDGIVQSGAVVNITDNYCSGLSNNGTVVFEDGAKLTITGNVNDKGNSSHGGGIYNSGDSANLTLPSDAVIYNNHANTDGDDIFSNTTATITFGKVGSDWVLDDCGDLIDGWYLDGAIQSDEGITIDSSRRWEAHAANFSDNYAELFDPFTVTSGTTETDEPESDTESIPVISALTSLFSGANSTDGSDGGESGSSQNTDGAAESTNVATVTGPLAIKAAHGIKPLDPSNPDDPNSPDWERSKSKTATELDENYESQVTLALPSQQEELVSDVVFVLDKSTSADLENQIIDMLSDLSDQVTQTGAKVNVGVVIFNKEANPVLELTELNANNMSKIEEAIKKEISSGTNTHAGLLKGIDMLEGDETVADSRKYLIFASDGITYMYNEDPTAIGLQNADKTNVFAGPDNWNTKYGTNNGPESWDNWLSIIGAQIDADAGIYDFPYGGTYENFIGYDDRDNHAMSIDKALYLTNEAYELAASKYHCYAVKASTSANHPWASSFMSYLADGESVSFEDIQKDIYYLLDAGSEVVDVMGYGTDNLNSEYDFDFVQGAENLKLTVGENELDTTDITETTKNDDANVTSVYGFGSVLDDGSYAGKHQYELWYYANGQDGNSDECFVWKIYVPVTNFERVSLTYTVKLTNPDENTPGTHGQYDGNGTKGYDSLFTNKEATLYPVDSNGEKGWPENFRKPTVEYTPDTVTVWPADMTIYMGGTQGYEGVVEGSGGSIVQENTNSLPEPGFYIDLGDDLNKKLKAEYPDYTTATDLTELISFSQAGDETRGWKFQKYGATNSEAYDKFVYRLVPTGTDQDPVRLEFKSGDQYFTSDNFIPTQSLSNEYEMGIYAGGVDLTNIVMTIKIGDETYTRAVKVDIGKLTVRYVVDSDEGNPVTGVVSNIADAGENAGKDAYAVVSESAKYYINKSDIDTTGEAAPSLLFDSIVTIETGNDDATAFDDALLDKATDVIGSNFKVDGHESKYLDLVDANNGNAWLTTDSDVTVYWPYPEKTNSSTSFRLVHVQGLDRDMTVGEDNQGIFDEIEAAPAKNIEVETTEYGVKFTLKADENGRVAFSPFVLMWGTTGGTVVPGDDEGDLTVSKKITGNLSSTDDVFTFTVTVEGVDGTVSTSAGDIEFDNGTATIALKGGQSITFYDLPEGAEYAVVETDANGYKLVSAVGDEGEITDGTVKASFTNDKSETVDPDDPDEPDTPDEPDEPDTPDEPDEPDTPDTPDDPDEPDTPDTPGTPDEPDQPAGPGKPSKPSEPSQPSKPSEPARPNVPDTGDHTNAALPVLLALGGAALVGGALWVKVRKDH